MNIYTVVFNNLNLIRFQKKTFDKFLKEDFKFNIIDNTNNQTNELKKICKELNINYIAHKRSNWRNIFNSNSTDHCLALNSVCKNLDFTQINMFIDSDIFLIKDFTLKSFDYYYFYGFPQNRKNFLFSKNYYWPGLFIINSLDKEMGDKIKINFLPTKFPIKTDSGGSTYKIFERYKDKSFFFDQNYINNMNFNKRLDNVPTYLSMQTYYKNSFLHYGAGSNWNNLNSDKFKKKYSFFLKIMNDILNE